MLLTTKTPKRSFFGPPATGAPIHAALLLPSLFPSEVARYANHFSSLLGSPKIPFCRVQNFFQQNEPHETNFLSHSANFPKIHAAIVQASAAHHCELPGLGNFPALVRSSVEPFLGISNFDQKRQNALFLGRCCSATGAPIHAALLLPSLSS